MLSKNNILVKGAATMMVAALYACGAGSDASSAADSLLTPTTFVDSLSVSFGDQWGARKAQTFLQHDDEKRAELDIDEFMAGLRSALLVEEPTHGVIKGISTGVDIASQLDAYSAIGMHLNRCKVMDPIERILTTDTLPSQTVADYQMCFDELIGGVQNIVLEQIRQARREQFLAEEKMRRENEAAAKAYVEKLKVENPGVKQTESGLVYQITAAGRGDAPRLGSTVSVVYEIKSLDGRVIDSSLGKAIDIPFDADLIPGLQEGFALLAPGAEATFYIPSRLGFGRDYKGVNPGEMIIVQVKLNAAI